MLYTICLSSPNRPERSDTDETPGHTRLLLFLGVEVNRRTAEDGEARRVHAIDCQSLEHFHWPPLLSSRRRGGRGAGFIPSTPPSHESNPSGQILIFYHTQPLIPYYWLPLSPTPWNLGGNLRDIKSATPPIKSGTEYMFPIHVSRAIHDFKGSFEG